MKRVSALDLCIRYFGKWQEQEERMQTKSAYSKTYFNFTGKRVKAFALAGPNQGCCAITLDGQYQGTVDCHANTETEICIFEKEDVTADIVHNLVIELCPGTPGAAAGNLTILGFAAEESVHYPKLLRKQMLQELAQIESGDRQATDPATWQPPQRKAKLPQHGVKLNAGLLRNMFDLNIENLKYNATIPWYSEGRSPNWMKKKANVTEEELSRPGWAGWAPGQIEGSELGGAAGVLRWEEDEELRRVCTEILDKMLARQREDGYYNYYPEEASFALKCFHPEHDGRELPRDFFGYEGLELFTERKNADRCFWTRGMLEAIHAELPGAQKLVRDMYDWFNRQEQYLKYMRYGANATNGDIGGPMAYHTPEGKPEDIITNQLYYDQNYWMEAFAQRQPMAMSHYPGERPHSTSLLCVQAMADMYLATGEQKYLDAVLGCWDVYTRYYRHPGGLAAIIEFDCPYPPGAYELYKHAEETCGHTNWMWINDRLMQLFPEEEKYAAEVEACIYNTLINSVQYHKNVYHILLHGKKENGTNWNSCCQISAQISVSSLPQYIFTYGEEEIYVNLFASAKYDAPFGTVTMETDFPYSNHVRIRVDACTDKPFTMNVRVPNWAKKDMEIRVNGQVMGCGKPGSYVALQRQWHAGDEISFTLPTGLDAVLYTGVDQAPDSLPRYTFLHGPILMAMTAPQCVDETVIPRIPMDIENLLSTLQPDEKLHYAVPGTEYVIMPYWDAPEEGFTCVPIVAQ